MGVSGGSSLAPESKLRHYPAFVRFWLASTVSDFGTYITTLALSVLILVTMSGTPLDQGLVNAARWTPYLLFGSCRCVDRQVPSPHNPRRRRLRPRPDSRRRVSGRNDGHHLGSDFDDPDVRLWDPGADQRRRVPELSPQLVPRSLLIRANARLQQSDTVAQTTGSA